MKVLWLDTETTGLDPEKNGLIEIAGLFEVDRLVMDGFNILVGLFDGQEISEDAAGIQGKTVEEFAHKIDAHDPPILAHRKLKFIFDQCVNKYDREDKMIIAGYNISFDVGFIEAFFRKIGDPYLYSYIRKPMIDILAVCRYLSWAGIINVENHKLATVCEEFGIEFDAHTALEDIRATRELALKIKNLIGGNLMSTTPA